MTTSRQAFGSDLFGNLGIDLETKKIVVLKIQQSAYGPLPQERAPKWPFDEQPFAHPNV